MPRRTTPRDRAALALDVVVGVSTAVAALRAVELGFVPGQLVRTVAYAVVLVGAVCTWWVWRSAARRPESSGRRLGPQAVVFVVLTGSLFFIGDQPLVLPLFVVGLIMVQRSYGLRGGVLAVAVLVGLQAVVFLVLGRAWDETAEEVLASALLFGFALLVAWLFAEIDLQRRDTALLAAAVQRRSQVEAELASVRERSRGARDLHDGIGHQVTVMIMSLQYAERMRDRDPDRAWDEVTRAREQAAAALADIRQLARALHPRGVGAAGAADLSALAASFSGTGLAVRVDDEAVGLELPEELALFRQRFVQEALTNAVKHSAATTVTVSQRVRDHELTLTVADDGGVVGPVSPGFGLASLAERADELGGRTSVTTPRTGLVVAARVPLPAGTS